MEKICEYCRVTKPLNLFVNQKINGIVKYRNKCKECKNSSRRTGKISHTRFKPGHEKGIRYRKGDLPWYKVKGLDHPCKGKGKSLKRHSAKTQEWCKKVKERDGWKCTKCDSTNNLAAHHITPWNEDENLRFELNNGTTLCCSCHAKIEGLGTKIRPPK